MDWNSLAHELIVGAPAFIAASAAAFVSIRNSRKIDKNTKITEDKANEVSAKVETVHELVNGNTNKLVESTRVAALAEGRAIGHQETVEKKRRIEDGSTPLRDE